MNVQRAASTILATLSAALVLGACTDGATQSADEPRTSSRSSPARADATGYRVLGPTSRADLEPGRWAVAAAGSRDVPLAVLDLPAGLNGGGEYVWSQGGTPENDGWILGYWNVGGVHVDPCRRIGGTFDTRQLKFPDIWVEALAAQRRTTTSDGVPVSLDGYDGVYVELVTPSRLDYSTCRENGLAIFDSTTQGDHHVVDTPGVVERYWVLDVGGERLVLTGAVLPETTDAQIDQLTQVVDSVRFERFRTPTAEPTADALGRPGCPETSQRKLSSRSSSALRKWARAGRRTALC